MSNGNQYIEAAKIAAETAADTATKNAQTTLIITLISAGITLMGIIITALITHRNAKRNALVETISKQRIEWVNDLRAKFVDFNTLADQYYLAVKMLTNETDNEPKFDFTEKYHSLGRTKNNIELLLNPSEVFAGLLTNNLDEVVKLFFKDDFKIEDYEELINSVEFYQQLILKSEWKRVKTEIVQGRELTTKEVRKIYEKIARKLSRHGNIETSNSIFTASFTAS
ncbi:hypothetical protein CU084_17675 [Bacillus velezensis]|uniref:hypothetical protein n=2 Tax=Bacillaceae TaxID=186817 RepID=UPI00086334E1|nr:MULTISPECIES: hypothetical protein [Bacillus amyloliquefaciens group]AOU01227.1 hypothetical protein A2I97_09140 [Bacillus velezensis]ATX84794.1 hypothetical protein CU084_17675 [Bacillus velezensis]